MNVKDRVFSKIQLALCELVVGISGWVNLFAQFAILYCGFRALFMGDLWGSLINPIATLLATCMVRAYFLRLQISMTFVNKMYSMGVSEERARHFAKKADEKISLEASPEEARLAIEEIMESEPLF